MHIYVNYAFRSSGFQRKVEQQYKEQRSRLKCSIKIEVNALTTDRRVQSKFNRRWENKQMGHF